VKVRTYFILCITVQLFFFYIKKQLVIERECWDPKDGELCLSRMKPGETLVEVRRRSDVQIDALTWV
jgi:hypothetical protein